jgi:hypothetical protein
MLTGGTYWWDNCQDTKFYTKVLRKVATAGMSLIALNAKWLFYAVFYHIDSLRCRALLRHLGEYRFFRWLRQYRYYLRIANAFACGVLVWLFLGVFLIYRRDVLSRAGAANKDMLWTFGQVMALSTWLGVLFHFVDIFLRECTFIFQAGDTPY